VIDFVSTEANVDPQTRGCAHLLAAVIADAIRGATESPWDREVDMEQNVDSRFSNHDPLLSIHFLFGDDSPFELYAKLIGLDAQAMREALVDNSIKLDGKRFTEFQRRTVRLRHHWYLKQKAELEAQGKKFKFKLSSNIAKQEKNHSTLDRKTIKSKNAVWNWDGVIKLENPTTEESNGLQS